MRGGGETRGGRALGFLSPGPEALLECWVSWGGGVRHQSFRLWSESGKDIAGPGATASSPCPTPPLVPLLRNGKVFSVLHPLLWILSDRRLRTERLLRDILSQNLQFADEKAEAQKTSELSKVSPASSCQS